MADAATLSVLLRLKDEASQGLKNFTASLEGSAKAARQAGVVLAGFGAAGAAALGLLAKAAFDETASMEVLSQAMRRVGASYRDAAPQIENLLRAQMRQTNFSDTAQREALSRLITTTGDYQKSLEALPTVLDVAAELQMDLGSAALLVGRAMVGSTEMLVRYGIRLKENATATETLTALQKQFVGSAEAAANPLTQLKNDMAELAETLGMALIPAIKPMIDFLREAAAAVGKLAQEHPLLTKVMGATMVAIVGVSLALGTALLAFGTLVPAIKSVGLAMAILQGLLTGPAGIAVALAAAAAGAVAFAIIWKKSMGEAVAALAPLQGEIKRFSETMAEFEKRTGRKVFIAPEGLENLRELQETTAALTASGDNLTESIIAIANSWQGAEDASRHFTGVLNEDLAMQEKLLAFYRQAYPEMAQLFRELFGADIQGQIAAFQAMLQKTQPMAMDVGEALKSLGVSMADVGRAVLELGREGLGAGFDKLWQALGKGVGLAQETVAKIREALGLTEAQFNRLWVAIGKTTEALKIQQTVVRDVSREYVEGKNREIEATLQAQAIAAFNAFPAKARQEQVAGAISAFRFAVGEGGANRGPLAAWVQGRGLDEMGEDFLQNLRETIAAAGFNPSSYIPRIKRGQGVRAFDTSIFGGFTELPFVQEEFDPVSLPNLQHGGRIARNGLAVVGERGPELVHLPQGATVTPHGGSGLTVNLNGPIYGFDDFRKIITQTIRDAALGGGFHGIFQRA